MHIQNTLVVNRRLLEEIVLNPGVTTVEMDYSKTMFDLLHTPAGFIFVVVSFPCYRSWSHLF